MDRFDRIYQLDKLLQQRRRPVPLKDIQACLECSSATAKRAIEDVRDFLGAPLVYVRKQNGYRYEQGDKNHPYQLPGLWFNSAELQALVVMRYFLRQLDKGLFEAELGPIQHRLTELLEKAGLKTQDELDRIRILNPAERKANPYWFSKVAEAVLQRHRLEVLYHGRSRDDQTERLLSPQRLIHYRDNWYLDAWCHSKRALRTFSLDRIQHLRKINLPAREIAPAVLNAYSDASYGIFSGQVEQTATLGFNAKRARWVADETWHPEQKGQMLDDGSYQLEVPYGNPTELIMDILKYGPDVEVVAPESLREQVANALREALKKYE